MISPPPSKVPTIDELLRVYTNPVKRRRALMSFLRALNADQSETS